MLHAIGHGRGLLFGILEVNSIALPTLQLSCKKLKMQLSCKNVGLRNPKNATEFTTEFATEFR